jgi:hypothetical protein
VSIHSIGLGKDSPLVVSPRQAQHLLSVGNTRFYQLLKTDEIISYKDGKSRKIVVSSIQAYVDRRVAASRHAENKAPAVPDHPIGVGRLRGGA